jgi:hypothetical protein
VRIDKGKSDGVDLSGLNVALLIDIPGKMARGNYTLAGYIDERASDGAFAALVDIFSGQAKGTTGLLSVLVSNVLGFERSPVIYTNDGNTRRLEVGKFILGEVAPITGNNPDRPVTISNSEYWPSPNITVARASRGRVRAFGRVWDFEDRSAEILALNWKG